MTEERQCTCTTPEITIKLNKQGPQGKVGPQGEPGFSPYVGVANDTPSQYILRITNEDGEYLTPNLKANIPLGGSAGTVLTKNSDVNGDCSFKALPYATTSQQGVVYLATTEEALLGDPDYAITGEVLLGVLANKIGNGTITLTQGGVTKGTFTTNQAGNTSIALDGTPANMVTTDTIQTITGTKTFSNGLRTLTLRTTSGTAYMTFNPSALGSQLGLYADNTTVFGDFVIAGTALVSRDGSSYNIVDSGNISSYLPDIPTVGNGTITFTQGGVTKGTITTNQSGNATIEFDAGGGGSYTGGNGINITNDTISIDNTVVATQSDISNMVTTDTAQTVTGRKTFNVIDANNVVTSSVSIPIGYSSFTLTGGANSDTIYLGTSAGVFNNGYLYAYNTQIGTDNVCIRTNHADNKVLLKATNVSIERNSTEYTNIDSGNIGSYIPTINGGNANA